MIWKQNITTADGRSHQYFIGGGAVHHVFVPDLVSCCKRELRRLGNKFGEQLLFLFFVQLRCVPQQVGCKESRSGFYLQIVLRFCGRMLRRPTDYIYSNVKNIFLVIRLHCRCYHACRSIAFALLSAIIGEVVVWHTGTILLKNVPYFKVRY